MKKRAAAAILGVMLSMSMALEIPAAALDTGFESEFTAEQTEDVPQAESDAEVQPSETTEDTADVSEAVQPEENADSENTEADADGFSDGFISEDTVDEAGSTEPVQEFASEINDTQAVIPEVQAGTSDNVFEWKDWEETASGFRLRKKKAAVSVQASDAAGEAGAAEAESFETVSEDGETAAVENADAAPLAVQDEYYTAADGIVEISTRTETGAVHTGSYLFDANGILVTGIKTLNGTESTNGAVGEFFFTNSETAEAYAEFSGKGAALVPGTSTIGQMKKNYWLWSKETGSFHYYGADGKALTVAQLDEAAKAQNTYTGYFKINDEYYCLDEKGTPRTGDVTLTVNGTAAQYYFMPAESENDIPGKMFRDGWKKFDTASGEQWKYYDSGELDSTKVGQLLVHGVMVTDLDGRKDAAKSYLIDSKGNLLKSAMKKASDGKYYLTDKNGAIYKNRMVTYKKRQYYVTETGAKATWKNCWHRCPGAGNRMYYFGKTPGRVVKKTGWQKVTTASGKFYGWFLFNNNGNHYAGKFKSGCYLKADGRLASGITVIKGKSYFFKPSTSTTRNGQLVKNQMFVYKKRTYFADSKGVLRKNGWANIDGSWYYFRNMSIVKNEFIKKGSQYGYVDSTGKYTTGWVIVDNANNLVRYINPDKKGFVTNTSKWIDGKLYYFDKNGYRINDVTNIYKSGYTLEVDRVNGVMTIYADANRTIPVKSIRVSVGNPGTETPTGRYNLTRYSRWQALMGPSWGQYGTHVDGAGQGGIFVHSIACGAANSYNLPVSAYYRLGSPASHGCIRTCVADAKWVYENCNGSTIYIFDGKYKSDEVFKGPLGRRPITPLKGTKNGGYYDPTDPAA